jgi:lysophospholipase L1-like esterase
MKTYSYLALGDSYTIGEQVPITESFPYQLVQLLRKQGMNFQAPEIIAATGWTTDDLKLAIDNHLLLSSYDLVSLLIGVNNQYRGRSAEEFRLHFRMLLETALNLAGGITQNLVVLSIPDWGVTPYAKDREPPVIAQQIDLYNFMCQAESEQFQVNYINITAGQRVNAGAEGFLAADGLHPSAKEYKQWSEKICSGVLAGWEI